MDLLLSENEELHVKVSDLKVRAVWCLCYVSDVLHGLRSAV